MSFDDRRLDELLKVIETLASGNFDARFPISRERDALDALGLGVNTLAHEVESGNNEVRAGQQRHRAMLKANPDLVFLMDSEGYIRDFHAHDESLLAVPVDQIIGGRMYDLLPPDAVAELRLGAEAAFASAGQVTQVEYTLALPPVGGRVASRVFEARFVACSEDEVVATIRDVTDWREHERELDQARRDAQAANDAKSAFLANMSHELRTPLHAIIGFADLLATDLPVGAPQRGYVNRILDGGQHLLAIINDLLDLSRVEAGGMTLSQRRAPLGKLVSAVLQTLTPLANDKSVDLRAEIPADLPDALIDPTRVRQIIYNLLSNALKFTPHGGAVVVSAVAEADEIRVTVTDTGVGIAEENLERVFGVFERVDEKAGVAGTGLGLPLTRRLVELHGGEMSVESALGVGSTFSATFPIAR